MVTHSANAIEIGFYNPTGVHPEFAEHVDFAMIEVINEEQVLTALAHAEKANLQLTLNIGPVITESLPIDQVNLTYPVGQEIKTKRFTPKPKHKIKRFVSEQRITAIIERLALAMQAHPGVIDTVFLIDEPYLKGVIPETLDRVARQVKAELRFHNVTPPKVGVVFASMMYHPEFASELSRQASVYAFEADTHYDRERSGLTGFLTDWFGRESRWIQGFKAHRLVTYDQAGNLYTEGGLPREVDVIGFNFYASTLLLDDLYQEIPPWLFNTIAPEACQAFQASNVADIRNQLSFFAPTPSGGDGVHSDQEMLDQLFSCRLKAVGHALTGQMRQIGADYEVVMIGESSSNGVMNFDENRGVMESQNDTVIEKRVLQEVNRYLDPAVGAWIPNLNRIAFFTYNHTRDYSIKQTIRGAESLPAVKARIFEAAAEE